ncbi:unnamed protein product [Moneuplotes crassus]|uniref:Uncharacterized protein n=1 Tax=Euplotes crassus TaxID=5936 RepID=A0AAD1UMB9_EUPCR|nr:unnamed protein product [Moneuplotes crassus]
MNFNSNSIVLENKSDLLSQKVSDEFNTFPNSQDIDYQEFFQADLPGSYGVNSLNVFNNVQDVEEGFSFFEGDNDSLSPKIASSKAEHLNSSENIFKFCNKIENSMIGELGLIGVTQSSKEQPMQFGDINLDTCQADCDFDNNNNLEEAPKKLVTKPEMTPKKSNPRKCKAVRRDVINKTIFRIIRRYYHKILEKVIPDYKEQKKNDLVKLLEKFSDLIFPEVDNSNEMAKVMSALMFRREALLSKKDVYHKPKLRVFLDIQSKYSHKLLSPVLKNRYFRMMFEMFLQNGSEFFISDENVASNFKVYHQELEKIKDLFFSMEKSHF